MMTNPELLSFMTKPASLEEILNNDEHQAIRVAADKLSERLGDRDDADGILTASRTLIETTCKTLLDCLDVEYSDRADLPDLSKKLMKSLDLHPASKTEDALKQVGQGAISMVNGIAFLRNAHGDAHGRGLSANDFPFRHAELSAYIACSLTRYFVETFEAKVARKTFKNMDDAEKEQLIDVWLQVGAQHKITNPDRLPYTNTLEEIAQQFTKETGIVLSRKDIYLGLQNLRKASSLPKPTF